jgi:4-hydroxy-tetrahydrodipicolinate synthase
VIERETVAFFKTIADATDLPSCSTIIPWINKIEMNIEMFDELQDCKKITAVKESTRDVSNVTRMRKPVSANVIKFSVAWIQLPWKNYY